MAEDDPFKYVRQALAEAESRLEAETCRYEEVNKRLLHEMAQSPGSERGYREAIRYAYHNVGLVLEEIYYWRTHLPPFAEARGGVIWLNPVTPENAHLLSSSPPTSPS